MIEYLLGLSAPLSFRHLRPPPASRQPPYVTKVMAIRLE